MDVEERRDGISGKRRMSDELEFIVRSTLIGIGATVVVDLWAQGLKRFRGIQPLNWRMVGRWLGHMPSGQFMHENMARASPVRGEVAIGWMAHYAIGIVFAMSLAAIEGIEWARHPTLLPALVFGLLTVAIPFLVMQPGMGAGLAASKTSAPNRARLRSVFTHTVFGVGLYGSALLSAFLIRL